jgi:hypothetical protein
MPGHKPSPAALKENDYQLTISFDHSSEGQLAIPVVIRSVLPTLLFSHRVFSFP